MNPGWTRRSFLMAVTSALPVAGATVMGAPYTRRVAERGSASMLNHRVETIQDVIDLILEAVGVEPIERTVDTIKSGDPAQPVTGVATTFLATTDVIERAASAGANLIITHEPTFYNHFDQVDWLEDDAVYLNKRRLLEEHGIVVWRFHDYMHAYRPDGIMSGLLGDLEWSENASSGAESIASAEIVQIEPTALRDLVGLLKQRLHIEHPLRVLGDPTMTCRRVGILPGAWGGRPHIEFLGSSDDVDVLLVGEINEWETSVYVQDAASAGRQLALVMLGHLNSEEPGMAWLAEWLRPRLEGIPVEHLPGRDPFLLI